MTTESAVEKHMQLDILDSGIACLTIDMRGSKVNTLGTESMTDLAELIDRIKADSKVNALVISSGKPDSFVAGGDLKEFQAIQARSLSELYLASSLGQEIFRRIAELPFNTVAAINGICVGGGAELALACKFRIASKNAEIGLPEVKLGFVPCWGGSVRLPRLVGVAAALDLVLASKLLDAASARQIGLVDEVVESKDLLSRAMQIARGGGAQRVVPGLQERLQRMLLETNPLGLSIIRERAWKRMMEKTEGKYPAAIEALDLIISGMTLPEKKAFELESTAFAQLAMTEMSRNLVGLFFAQQESKKLPVEVPRESKIATVGVVGAGVMGAGIAQAAANAGYRVIVRELNEELADRGRESVARLFGALVDKRGMKQAAADKIMKEMLFTTDYAQLSQCDLVIEAVGEDLETKRRVLAELENVVQKDFIFASSTSFLSINKLSESGRKTVPVIGLHFFNPVQNVPLVEIVKSKNCDEKNIALVMSFAMDLGKTTVTTSDSPGFVVNRILAPYLREALELAAEGVPVEDIDRAMKSFGMRAGPLAWLDEVGLDIAGKMFQSLSYALGERLVEPPLLKSIQHQKLLGKRSGKGIYLYETGKTAGVNPCFQSCIKTESRKLQLAQIQDRLVLLLLNEAARCLEEDVVSRPSQLDLALICGSGFPPGEGGILRYADRLGVRLLCDKLELLAQIHGARYSPADLLKEKARHREGFYCRFNRDSHGNHSQ